jgi:hypothetical protein
LTDKEYQRLEPFLHRKSARQRLILFLIADGYTVVDLVGMRAFTLHTLKLPIEMSVYRDEALANHTNSMAFIYPNDKPLPHTAYYRLVRDFTLRTLKLPIEMSVNRDEALANHTNSMAFIYPNGKPLPHTAYYRLVRVTAEKVLGRPMSQEQFRAYIHK